MPIASDFSLLLADPVFAGTGNTLELVVDNANVYWTDGTGYVGRIGK